MAKFIPPQGLREIGIRTSSGTKVIRTGKDGLFNVDNPKLERKLKEEGLGIASASGVIVGEGFPCAECGFGSWFKKCSRCGHENERIERDGSSG
jgi:hypothetical protein